MPKGPLWGEDDMRAKALVTIAVTLATGTSLCALAETFNAKPGAWEMNVTTLTTGNPIPADVLAQMSPDKRAEIEEAMKARAGKPDSHTFKTCMTQKDLDQNSMIKSEKDSTCAKKVLSKSATKIVIEQTCPAPRASAGKATIEARTPEKIVAIIDTVQGGDGGQIHIEMKGRWLGASCEAIKAEE